MAPAAAAGNPERPGGNCVKIGLPGKSILRDYFQESGTSQRHFPYLESIFYRLPNDCRPGRLLDSEIIIDFKILVGVVLRSVLIVSIIGWNGLESCIRVQKSGRDHDR